MDFTNKVVLVTGASSGIGAEIAIHFAKLSAKLALVGRNEENLNKTASLCEKEKNIKPLTIIADISKEADIERIIKETIDHFSALDVLINNAGISIIAGIKTTTLEIFDTIMSTNLRGTFYLTSLAVPHLIKSKGSIVNVSSLSSIKPYPRMLVYSMLKAALDHFTRNIALELGPEGVRVNSVNPGVVITELMTRMGLDEAMLKQVTGKFISETPLKRLAETSDVAVQTTFLASDLAKSITGCTHIIDGGRFLY